MAQSTVNNMTQPSSTTTASSVAHSDQDDDDDGLITPVQASIFSAAPPGSSANSSDPISEEDENVLRYFMLLRPTGPAATVLAKISKTLYCGGGQSVKDYFISLGLSNKDYRKAFTTQERDVLDAGTSWDSFDITFLHKLLQRVCGLAPSSSNKWVDPDPQDSDELEHSLYLIKSERNFLAHEAVSLTDFELQSRSQRLMMLLENVLIKTGLKKNTDYSHEVVDMKSSIREVLDSSTRVALHVYQKELEDLRRDIVNKVVQDSQSELFPKYLHLWTSSSVGFSQSHTFSDTNSNVMPRTEQVFTSITIKDRNETVVKIGELFSYNLPDGSLPRLLIIEGIAGIGKSHVCKYIAKNWASSNASDVSLFGVEIVIYIECHSVNSKSLREFLSEELLQQTCSSLRHEDVIPALGKCHVVFIIDGMDEAGTKAKKIIREVNIKFPTSRVLITCRPEFTETARLLLSPNSKCFCIFYAKGFNNMQQKEYLYKLLTSVKTTENESERSVDILYNKVHELEHCLHSLLCLPLTMMMLVLLWLEDADCLSVMTTVTHIHKQTIDMRIQQLAQRIQRKPDEIRHITLIERVCRQWLATLSKVAWQTLLRNTQVLDESSTDELFQKASDHDIDPVDAMSCFLKCTTWEKVFRTEYIWEFFHKAFQEYLSALYLSLNFESIDYEQFNQNSLVNTLQQPSVITPHRSHFSRISSSSRSQTNITPWKDKCLSLFCCSCLVKKYKYSKNIYDDRHSVNFYCYSADFTLPSSDMYSSDMRIALSFDKRSPKSKSVPIRKKRRKSPDGLMEESPYSLMECNVRLQRNAQHHNMLLFLGSMEASKEEVDFDVMKDILQRFSRTMLPHKWLPWATFLRECKEHPVVCQLIRNLLDGKDIGTWGLRGSGMLESFECIEYLLKKTEFIPGEVDLWFNDKSSFPDVLGSMLSTLANVSPTAKTNLNCSLQHCLALRLCLAQLDRFDLLDLSLTGKIVKSEDFVDLMKYLGDKDVEFILDVMVEKPENLNEFAKCCLMQPLPKRTILKLFVCCTSEEMLNPLCQVLHAFSWTKSFSFVFTHTDLGDKVNEIQRLLTDALREDLVQLTDVELGFEDHVRSDLDSYKEMAQSIAGDVPNSVVFFDGTDGDNISLVFKGTR